MSITIQLPSNERKVFDTTSILIGSAAVCDIQLAELRPQHAKIRKLANRWMVESLGDWPVQSGENEPGKRCWLKSGEHVTLTPDGPALVFQPSEETAQPAPTQIGTPESPGQRSGSKVLQAYYEKRGEAAAVEEPVEQRWKVDQEEEAPIVAPEEGSFADSVTPTETSNETPARQLPKELMLVARLIGGGVLGIILAVLILWWGLGRDPFGLAPQLPGFLTFLAPSSLREELIEEHVPSDDTNDADNDLPASDDAPQTPRKADQVVQPTSPFQEMDLGEVERMVNEQFSDLASPFATIAKSDVTDNVAGVIGATAYPLDKAMAELPPIWLAIDELAAGQVDDLPAATHLLEQLSKVGYVQVLTDFSDDQVATIHARVKSTMARIAENDAIRKALRTASATRLGETADMGGIAVFGTVRSFHWHGRMFEMVLELGDGQRVSVHSWQDPATAFRVHSDVVVLGVVLRKPTEQLVDYVGDGTTIIWSPRLGAVEH